MKKDYTHISFVLDRSGSMNSIKQDTIGGFNEFLRKQKEEKGECTFSMIQFDVEYQILHSFVSIKDVPELNDETFVPRSTTALYDALGRCIISTGEKISKMKEEEKPEKVLFVILTDGMENSSMEFSYDKIKEMIKHQSEKYNWKFIYLGANQDAIAVAQDIGINSSSSMSFAANEEGVKCSYVSLSNSIGSLRKMKAEDYNSNENEIFSQEDRNKQNEAMKK